MAKNVFQNLILSIIILAFYGCSTSPTYTRKNIEKVIERICKDEFNIKVNTLATGETIWIYAPFEGLIKDNKEINEEEQEKIRYIFLSLKRTILSMGRPPKFFAFVASNIKGMGADIYYIGFVPDIIKYELQFISDEEFEERIVSLSFENPEALDDEFGLHISMGDITMGDFITQLAVQKIIKVFSGEKIKNHVEIKDIAGTFEYGEITITIDIEIKKGSDLIPGPIEETKKALIRLLKIYEELSSDIDLVTIEDKIKGTKRSYSIKALLENQAS